jgi:hypothetical protein
MRLYHDWFGLLNRGLAVTPIGASDSHDVARKLVAQGRTYVRCADEEPGDVDVAKACRNLREGRVVVSMGLFTEIKVNDRYEPGDLAPVEGDVQVSVQVLGPTWVTADRVRLFANGLQIEEATIQPAAQPSVVKWSGHWKIPRPNQDMYLVAIASGPGVTAPYWRIPKTYQPTSTEWNPYVISSTGPISLDTDGDGKRSSPYDYAAAAMHRSQGDLPTLVKELSPYDEATAAQAANLLAKQGKTLLDPEFQQALEAAAAPTRRGFREFLAAWKESQNARAAR